MGQPLLLEFGIFPVLGQNPFDPTAFAVSTCKPGPPFDFVVTTRVSKSGLKGTAPRGVALAFLLTWEPMRIFICPAVAILGTPSKAAQVKFSII